MLWAVIIAGGSGTRFWPASRARRPKQFLRIFGKITLLEETYDRIRPLVPKSRVLVLTQKENVREVVKLLKLPPGQVIGEPVGRNTAPAAILAASLIHKEDADAVLMILPSDQRIERPQLFRKVLRAAAHASSSYQWPVTFGIKPHSPHTGYGYLEIASSRKIKFSGLVTTLKVVKQFHEKPNLRKAQAFLRSGKFLWNSGMFVWRADDLLAAALDSLPYAVRIARQIVQSKHWKKSFRKLYSDMPNISMDYGLMEPLRGKILAIPVALGWSDLGGWQAYAELLARDPQGNRVRGKTLALESKGNIVKSERRLVALVGIHNTIIVDEGDALLICAKDKSERIRQVIAALKKKKWGEYL